MKLSELSVLAFTERVASCDPAPGGGSCAALYGCLGAALTAMVGGMTQNRKKYAEYENHAKEIEAKCGMLREKLADVMDRDTDAFLLVSDAYALPKATDEEKAARSLAIQEGLKACTRTPLEMMELMGEAVELIARRGGAVPESRHPRRLAERKDQYRFPEGQGLRGGGRGKRTGGPGLCSPRGG